MDAMDLRTAEGKVYGLMRTAWYQITACNAVGRVDASFWPGRGDCGRRSRTRAPSPPSRVGTSIGSDSYLDRDVASAVSRATTGPIWQTRDKGSGVQLRCFVKLTLIVASTEPCGASIYLARLTLWHLKSSPPSLAPPSNTTKNTVITRLLAPSSLKRHGCTNGDGFGDASVAPRAASGEAREDGRLHPP